MTFSLQTYESDLAHARRRRLDNAIAVERIKSPADHESFLRLPWEVYQGDASWAPPLWSEHVRYFDPASNAELRHIDSQAFIARRRGHVIGTVIAHINGKYNDFHDEQVGWFGQFEVLDDKTAAHRLLAAAEGWLRDRGAEKVMGPATFSSNSEWGLLIQGYEHPQMVMTTHARPYYREFIESFGFQKAMDLYSWYYNLVEQPELPPQFSRIARRLKNHGNYHIYHPRVKDWDLAASKALEIFREAWKGNWGFVPLNDDEQKQLASNLKSIIDPEMVIMVEKDGKPVAFAAPLIDVFQPIRLAHMKPGEVAWRQKLRFLWQWKIRKQVHGLRVMLMGVVKECRGHGLDALMYYEMFEAAKRKGFEHVEMSWVLETNDMMNRATRSAGSELYKIHRVYEKAI